MNPNLRMKIKQKLLQINRNNFQNRALKFLLRGHGRWLEKCQTACKGIKTATLVVQPLEVQVKTVTRIDRQNLCPPSSEITVAHDFLLNH